jgi:hypothetical protein
MARARAIMSAQLSGMAVLAGVVAGFVLGSMGGAIGSAANAAVANKAAAHVVRSSFMASFLEDRRPSVPALRERLNWRKVAVGTLLDLDATGCLTALL